jgi:hypothetical protein
MRLTGIIVILHILQRAELGLRGDRVALATLIFVRLARNEGEDVRFAILREIFSPIFLVVAGEGWGNTFLAEAAKVRYRSNNFAWFSFAGILNSVIRIIPAIFTSYLFSPNSLRVEDSSKLSIEGSPKGLYIFLKVGTLQLASSASPASRLIGNQD